MSITLRIAALTHRFGEIVALDGVTLSVPAGTILAIVGESGSGKSTLLRAVNRLVEPPRGAVWLDDKDVTTVDPVALRRRIGYVPQSGGLLPHWTVLRNAALVPTLIAHADPHHAAATALALCGLPVERYGHRYPHELSGGQRQRVALARALAAQQGLVLLDESFSALDAISRGDVVDAFAHVHASLGFTALLVTHDIGEAARLADTIAVMRAGRLEQVGSLAQLAHEPQSAYVRTLVSRAQDAACALAAV